MRSISQIETDSQERGNPRRYSIPAFCRDALAGLTVAAVELPQSIGYALLAGVPPQYGIFASVIQGAIAAIFSGSPYVVTAPTNTQSLLIISAVSRIVDSTNRPEVYLQLVFALTFIKGLMQLAFAALRFGDLTRFISRSVIVGLAAGAGILILVGQIPNLLGLRGGRIEGVLPGAIGMLQRLFARWGEVNPWSLSIGCGAILIIIAARAFSRLLPGALIALVLSICAVWLLGLEAKVPVIGALPRAIPEFVVPWPGWAMTHSLFAGALALASLGLIETVAIGKSMSHHQRIDPNREAAAQGLANLISSFFQSIPGSGSFTRSVVARDAGGATRATALLGSAFVAIAALLFSGSARFMPRSAIAGALIVISLGLIDWRYIGRVVRTSGSDALVCLLTLLATLTTPLEYAVFIGIIVNIALYLRTAARLHIQEMVQTEGGLFFERPIHDRHGDKQVIFLQLEGELFFGVADELQRRLSDLLRSNVRVIILRLKRTHGVDATVLHVLEAFCNEMRRHGKHLLLCGVREELETILRAYGLEESIGKENIFIVSIGVWTSAKRALARAKKLVDQQPVN